MFKVHKKHKKTYFQKHPIQTSHPKLPKSTSQSTQTFSKYENPEKTNLLFIRKSLEIKSSKQSKIINKIPSTPLKLKELGNSLPNFSNKRSNIPQHKKQTQPHINTPDPFVNMELSSNEIKVKNNPSYVVEYANDIFFNLKQDQHINQVELTNNKIDLNKRAMLINNIVLIHENFQLNDETLFLCINILDRFLLLKTTNLKNDLELLLAGISSLLIACKYNEIYSPEIKDFLYITKHILTKESVIQMEKRILTCLNFEVLTVSPLLFMERLAFLSYDGNNKILSLGKYLIELTLLDLCFYKYTPLQKACGALYLARRINNCKEPWDDLLQKQSGVELKCLKRCAKEICFVLNNVNNIPYKAIVDKYSKCSKMKVALTNQ